MEMVHNNASVWVLVYICCWLLFCLLVALFCLENYEEKLLTLTLETLGSKEVARWLVWLQNTKEHG